MSPPTLKRTENRNNPWQAPFLSLPSEDIVILTMGTQFCTGLIRLVFWCWIRPQHCKSCWMFHAWVIMKAWRTYKVCLYFLCLRAETDFPPRVGSTYVLWPRRCCQSVRECWCNFSVSPPAVSTDWWLPGQPALPSLSSVLPAGRQPLAPNTLLSSLTIDWDSGTGLTGDWDKLGN